jgi:hypothetical protein
MQQTPSTRRPAGGTGAVGHATPRQVRLRIVSGGLDEAVLRRKQFEDTHPEIVITPPGTHTCLWTAHRGGKILASGYQLSALLDTLSWRLGKQL